MKKHLSLWIILIVAVLAAFLCSCGASDETTGEDTAPLTAAVTDNGNAAAADPASDSDPAADPTTEDSTEAAEEPVVYTNPLTGEVLDAPYSGRIFVVSISNTPEVLPHVNAMKSDIIFESFVSDSIIRCWGLFTDISQIDRIGPVRSTRLMINDIADHYNAVLLHAGGKTNVLQDMEDRGLDNIRLDTWDALQYGASIRDEEREKKVGYEHSLLVMGDTIYDYAESLGISLKGEEGKDHLLHFAEDGTPADGEPATHIVYRINHRDMWKETTLDYDPQVGKYVYSQYGEVMLDNDSGEREAYTNVLLLKAIVTRKGAFQEADFVTGGEGYFACGGKIIPILWGANGEQEPLWFTTTDGEPLQLGVGNTYIAITDSFSGLVHE